LNIRALFKVSGKVHLTGVVRSRERGIEMMFEKIRAKVNGAPVHASVLHAYAPESVKPLMERMKREFNCVELWQSEFSPLMGYACGTGTLAVAFYPEITDAQS
jgi:fatty acid-binding protein DegV